MRKYRKLCLNNINKYITLTSKYKKGTLGLLNIQSTILLIFYSVRTINSFLYKIGVLSFNSHLVLPYHRAQPLVY